MRRAAAVNGSKPAYYLLARLRVARESSPDAISAHLNRRGLRLFSHRARRHRKSRFTCLLNKRSDKLLENGPRRHFPGDVPQLAAR